MNRIYISYRRSDTAAYAGRLFDHLNQHFGTGFVFMDVQGSIARGQDFVKAIDMALNTCDVALIIIGKHWATSTGPDGSLRLDDPNDWVRVETAAVLHRDIWVVPVLVDGAHLPKSAHLPEELRPLCNRSVCELTDLRWSYDVRELIRDIENVLYRGPKWPTFVIEKIWHPLKNIKNLNLKNNALHWSVGGVVALGLLFGIGIVGTSVGWFKKSISESMTPAESYRIRTDYFAEVGHSDSNVEFSVFVNDVQVGDYGSGGASADITRFVKPGLNQVRITWTADLNMGWRDYAKLIIEAKQGEQWDALITRQVGEKSTAGEINAHIFR
jgi:hypothetical protein